LTHNASHQGKIFPPDGRHTLHCPHLRPVEVPGPSTPGHAAPDTPHDNRVDAWGVFLRKEQVGGVSYARRMGDHTLWW